MARKTVTLPIEEQNRDHGKQFLITEMSATRAEAWAMKALLALGQSNVQLPEGMERMGMAAMAEMGLKALMGLKWEVVEPLLAEMMECVQIVPDPKKPHVTRGIMEEANDIEELTTRLKLRAEVWKLHTDFFKAVAPSMFAQSGAAASVSPGQTTKTSRRRSPR